MKITKIEPQKKNKNRMSVFLDDAFAFGIDAFSLYALKLKEGDEIDASRLAEIKETVLFESAKNYAAKLISARSYSQRDILKKLLDHTKDEELSLKVVEFLKEYKLIDDYDYAQRFVSDCLNLKRLGKRQIQYRLAEKGIAPEIIDDTLAKFCCQETEEENLYQLMKKKIGNDFEFKNVMKAKRYCASRGYGFDDIESALRKLKAEGEV